MKKLLFVIPAVVLAFCLAFCGKTEFAQEVNQLNHSVPAENRTQCNVQIFPFVATPLTYCGTGTNSDTCDDACVGKREGVEQITGDAAFTLETTDTFTTFSIASATGNTVIVQTATNQIGPIFIPAGTCQTITVDFNCVVSQ